ncbi:hypothetical protein [Candidatus Riesia pediculischaeffi]|nr:hypothetical protein [Candidatus Riesia pediculischaeffi]
MLIILLRLQILLWYGKNGIIERDVLQREVQCITTKNYSIKDGTSSIG